jgi:hypothetical protein
VSTCSHLRGYGQRRGRPALRRSDQRIFNRQNPCYPCSFLYDDARDAIGRHPRSPGTLPPLPTKSVAQALLPVCLCQVDDSTDGVCRPIGSRRFSNRERIAIFHPRFHPLAQKARATTRPPKVQPRFRPLQKNRDSYFDSHPFRPVPPAYLLAGARDLRSLVACRSSLVTGFLIYRTAIRNPCKALKT